MNEKTSSLPERIESAMSKLSKERGEKVTWTSLALEIGLSTAAPTNWKKGKISRETLEKIADLTQVDLAWLQTGKTSQPIQAQFQDKNNQYQIQGTTTRYDGYAQRMIPVISMVQAGPWTPVMSADITSIIEELPWIPDVGDHGFGVIVGGMSMAPYFLPNDRLYVNPDLEPYHEDLVIAMCEYETEATFKQFIVDEGRKFLVPLNKEWIGYRVIELDHSCKIKGVVVRSIRPIDKRLYRTTQ